MEGNETEVIVIKDEYTSEYGDSIANIKDKSKFTTNKRSLNSLLRGTPNKE